MGPVLAQPATVRCTQMLWHGIPPGFCLALLCSQSDSQLLQVDNPLRSRTELVMRFEARNVATVFKAIITKNIFQLLTWSGLRNRAAVCDELKLVLFNKKWRRLDACLMRTCLQEYWQSDKLDNSWMNMWRDFFSSLIKENHLKKWLCMFVLMRRFNDATHHFGICSAKCCQTLAFFFIMNARVGYSSPLRTKKSTFTNN